MTICELSGLGCDCQPDDGVPCTMAGDGLKRCMLEWRAEAIRLRAEAARLEADAARDCGVLPEKHPPPHARYLLERDGVVFTATPCYGMHAPWWVVKTLDGEAEPQAMQDGDKWTAIDAARAGGTK